MAFKPYVGEVGPPHLAFFALIVFALLVLVRFLPAIRFRWVAMAVLALATAVMLRGKGGEEQGRGAVVLRLVPQEPEPAERAVVRQSRLHTKR